MRTSGKYTHIMNVCTVFPLKSPTQSYHMIEYAQPCTYEPMYWVLCAYIHVYFFMYALTLHTMSIYVLYMHKFICLFFWTNLDVDECGFRNGGCSQVCHNVPGGYTCLCEAGFYLKNDSRTCVNGGE